MIHRAHPGRRIAYRPKPAANRPPTTDRSDDNAARRPRDSPVLPERLAQIPRGTRSSPSPSLRITHMRRGDAMPHPSRAQGPRPDADPPHPERRLPGRDRPKRRLARHPPARQGAPDARGGLHRRHRWSEPRPPRCERRRSIGPGVSIPHHQRSATRGSDDISRPCPACAGSSRRLRGLRPSPVPARSPRQPHFEWPQSAQVMQPSTLRIA